MRFKFSNWGPCGLLFSKQALLLGQSYSIKKRVLQISLSINLPPTTHTHTHSKFLLSQFFVPPSLPPLASALSPSTCKHSKETSISFCHFPKGTIEIFYQIQNLKQLWEKENQYFVCTEIKIKLASMIWISLYRPQNLKYKSNIFFGTETTSKTQKQRGFKLS